ncbi:DUF2281 domain-containing protein [Clostridiaceae bacterium UIB06]|uniref:DUF2281 domain-containing protein n=1 Tax=Clostridium thailandense TaxID=2794346 RepID=A0A949U0F7_9CLOT|nr:DUF2281 domain-containing protein [Clostridium thailandense]MCH5135842.1 DUF2281 domain-containing protein [Clostridiaceae bacterium UIB06]
MGFSEKIIQDVNDLSEEKQKEVIDFIEFLKQKQNKEDDEIIDKVVLENAEAMEELAKMCYLIVKDFNKKGSIAIELNDSNEVT